MITTALALALFAAPQEAEKRPDIDVVFCIDCSGSMRQIIDSAKQKVWSIVNELAKAQPTPNLRIGLLGYGDKTRVIHKIDLTDDLDALYEQLMKVTAENIGDEWVGWAIGRSVEEMGWSKGGAALKIVFVLGNETARQGPAEDDYTVTAAAAIGKDIVVNAVYCGEGNEEELDTWREVARLAEGAFTSIDLSGGVVSIATPHDQEMAELNAKLNKTYIAYGKEGRARKEKQEAQDANAQQSGGGSTEAERAQSKAGKLYRNADWDLVDASDEETFKIEDVKDEELPENMRTMTLEEKKAHVAANKEERGKVQKQIQELGKKRQAFIDEEVKKRNLDASKGFDRVIQQTLREQAAKKNFKFDE